MAEYILDVKSQTSKLDWAFPFQRTGAFPIDRSAVFSSLIDAQNYALGAGDGEEAKDERKLGGTSYVGQVISVYEAAIEADEENGIEASPASVNAYIITPTRSLMKLAATTASGNVAADIAVLQGQVSQLALDLNNKANASEVTEALNKKADKSDLAAKADKSYTDTELAKKANSEDVTNALSLKANTKDVTEALLTKANSSDVYNKTETYTKAEVQSYVAGQIGSAGHLKRLVVNALPDVEDANVDTIYMVSIVDPSEPSDPITSNQKVDAYVEYMVIDNAWEIIGDTRVDLTDYVTTSALETKAGELTKEINKKANQSDFLLAQEEIGKKANAQEVTQALALKADKEQVEEDIAAAIQPLAVKEEVQASLLAKADKEQVEQDIASATGTKAEKTYVDGELLKKADKATTLAGYGIADAYTKTQVDEALALKASQQDHNQLVDDVKDKADKATTLAGYGITDAYTKDETYTQQEIDNLLEEAANSSSEELEGYKTTNDERVKGAEDRIKDLEDVGAQANIIENIHLANENSPLAVGDNKSVRIPLVTTAKPGIVAHNPTTNGIVVRQDGKLEVNSLNVDKLVQATDTWMILNGGDAFLGLRTLEPN